MCECVLCVHIAYIVYDTSNHIDNVSPYSLKSNQSVPR